MGFIAMPKLKDNFLGSIELALLHLHVTLGLITLSSDTNH
jgi:hypothetical protein